MKLCMGCMEEYDESLNVCPHCGYVENTKPAEVYHMMPGSILAKKYIVGRTLGYGGFGVTYIGRDMELQRKVAIKEYLPGEFSTRIPGQTMVTVYEDEKHEQFQSGITKFMDEAKRLAKFQDSAGIVHIYDSFFENETAYIVMEYIEGETVKEKLEREGKIPVEEALKLILPIVAAMKEVHAEGIIHRDISPDNIMVDKEGNAKLIDFGASRYATTTHSKSLSVLIKYGYAPMEQYQSGGQQGTWTDVYALAATFYTMVTGIVPEDSLKRLEKDELKPLSKMGVKISKNVDMAIRNALNVKVEERTPSMEVFEEELLSEGEVARLVTKQERKDVGAMPVWVKAVTGCGIACVAAFVVLLLTEVISFSGGQFGSFVVAVGKTIVPNMVNVTVDQAEAAASENKLKIQIVGKVYSDEVPEGYILEQNIKPGTKVDEESILELTISAGVEMVYMPSVAGLTKEQAIALLEEQGLKYIIEEVEDATAPGYVVSQSVGEDEKVSKGTEITLKVSQGMADIDPEVEVEVPNLTGVDYTDAKKLLADLGLYIGVEKELYDNKIKKGGVIHQSVPSGNKIRQGETILVQVSLGEELVKVPDVTLKDEAEARKLLSSAGLMAEVSYDKDPMYKKGLVLSQDIGEGEKVKKGTTVHIVVNTGESETTKKDAKWSDWVEKLPTGVDENRYEINTKLVYSRRDKSSIESKDTSPASQGWTLDTTKTEPSDWGGWSEWSTTPQTGSDTLDVNKETRYSYRDKETTSSQTPLSDWTLESSVITGWTQPSAWSDSYIEGSTTRNVETQQVDDPNNPIYKTYYDYGRVYVTPETPNGWIHGPSPESVYNWTSKGEYKAIWENYSDLNGGWRDTPLKVIGVSGDRSHATKYEGDWYNERTEQRIVGYNKKTQYRYSDAIFTYSYYRWTNWSEPSTNPATPSATREVQQTDYYQYRTRTMVTTYYYSKWSEWSGYSDTPVTASDTTEVRTKTLYQYKEK